MCQCTSLHTTAQTNRYMYLGWAHTGLYRGACQGKGEDIGSLSHPNAVFIQTDSCKMILYITGTIVYFWSLSSSAVTTNSWLMVLWMPSVSPGLMTHAGYLYQCQVVWTGTSLSGLVFPSGLSLETVIQQQKAVSKWAVTQHSSSLVITYFTSDSINNI